MQGGTPKDKDIMKEVRFLAPGGGHISCYSRCCQIRDLGPKPMHHFQDSRFLSSLQYPSWYSALFIPKIQSHLQVLYPTGHSRSCVAGWICLSVKQLSRSMSCRHDSARDCQTLTNFELSVMSVYADLRAVDQHSYRSRIHNFEAEAIFRKRCCATCHRCAF